MGNSINSDKSPYKPQHLGVESRAPIDEVDIIPWDAGPLSITLRCDEFTSRCPVTGQPDFGEIEITYTPDRHIIETKSLKLYLTRYREQGVFSERLTTQIANDLYAQVKPLSLTVCGHFKSRGGISIHTQAHRPETGERA
jgi:7-cyano-7-deazaguanine reductase